MPSKNGYRFKVGTQVLCRTGTDEWSPGSIVALNYRESYWPPGETVPYQVRLLNGDLIFVPADVPQLCKQYVAPLWLKPLADVDMPKFVEATSKDCEAEDHRGLTPLLACVDKGWHEGALHLLSQRADPCKSAGPEKATALHLAVLPLFKVSFVDEDFDNVTFSREEGVISAKLEKPDAPEESIYDERLSSISYDKQDGQLSWVTAPEEGLSFAILPKPLRSWVPARLATLVRGTTVTTEGLPEAANSAKLVRALLEAHADVNAQNEDPDNDLENFTSTTYSGLEQREHRSPLHYAAEGGEAGLCAQLIAARATVNLQDRFKMTPLDLALEGESKLVVQLLLRNAADPNRGNMRRGLQQTSLHQASDVGNVEFVELLIQHGAKVNLAGKQGMTPLHLAARKKHFDVVKVLLNSGADVGLLDKSRKTPGQYAVTNRSKDLGKALAVGDDIQLCDRIAMLESAMTSLPRRHLELEERQAMLESLNAV